MGIKDIFSKLTGFNPAPIYSAITKRVNQNIAVYTDYTVKEYAEIFSTVDDVYSIVRYLYTTAALIPLYVYQVIDEKKHKKLNQIGRQELKMSLHRELLIKALEDLPDNDNFELLLNNPNSYQNATEFKEAYYFYKFNHGEAFIYKVRSDYGKNAGCITELHLLEPENIILKVTETFPRRVVAYDYVLNGQKVYENIPLQDIKHIKSFNPGTTYFGSNLRGLSPLQVLRKRLDRMGANLDVSVAQMQNGGVETIVYDKSPGTDEERAEINGKRKSSFYRFLQDKGNAGAPYFSSGEMGALHIGSTLADLKTIEVGNIDFKKLCNAFGVSDILFNNDSSATESNVKEMIAKAYTNTVLPAVYGYRDALKEIANEFTNGVEIEGYDEEGNETINRVAGDKIKRDVQADLSEIPELQENYKELAATFASLPVIIPNEILAAFKYDRSEDPAMDLPLIKTGYVPIGDMAAIPDIPIVTHDGN